MRILLDTCTFLWLSLLPEKISKKAKKIFIDCENEVFLSSISAIEINHKYKIGKLPLPEQPSHFIPKQRKAMSINPMPLTESDCRIYQDLPLHHRDPFDRTLISQAISQDCLILSPDPLLRKYDVKVEW